MSSSPHAIWSFFSGSYQSINHAKNELPQPAKIKYEFDLTSIMIPEPRSPTELRRWVSDEEHQLIRLRDQEHKKFEDIAAMLHRSIAATQGRYYTIKQRQHSSAIDWTPEHDHNIIDGRRRGLTIKDIATEMQIPPEATAERWYTLQRLKQVPEDVLVIRRRKGDVIFTPKEDEMILKIWIQMRDDQQLISMVKLKGKSQTDIRERRVELVNGHSPLYLNMLGVGHGKENETDALKTALGKPKYTWMK
ncbi:Nn.00g052260.m01.CDS01 [Neocucurbitaria sp. VM-36]